MSIKTRGLVFATFFINCIVVGLLLASLLTDHWIVSDAKIGHSSQASGTIHFGLFSGKKKMDFGLGARSSKIDIPSTLKSEPNFMSYWLWLGAFVGTGFGLLSSAVGGIASVMKSASQKKRTGTMVLLFCSNTASGWLIFSKHFNYHIIHYINIIVLFFFSILIAALSQLLGFGCWIAEFYVHLKGNVLMAEDRNNQWHSTNLSTFGHSFYFVLASFLFVIVNIVILIVVMIMEKKERRPVRQEPVDEKTVGAIMLY